MNVFIIRENWPVIWMEIRWFWILINIIQTKRPDYNRLEEKNETLNDGEVLLFSTQTKSYGQNEIYLDDTKFNVKKELDKSQLDEKNNDKDIPITYMIMKDEEQILNIWKKYTEWWNKSKPDGNDLLWGFRYERFQRIKKERRTTNQNSTEWASSRNFLLL